MTAILELTVSRTDAGEYHATVTDHTTGTTETGRVPDNVVAALPMIQAELLKHLDTP
ncbi:hypothetical protein ACFWY9_30610 [Amycolatopsis sp. NPDC059027]|uniref:hypothetical protein n=1 Tax=Amycolatopsis sp. NPDC059027 TaxID=3346709 RepID=UPI00366C50E2